MVKVAIVLLCLTLFVANLASRFIPQEVRKAARIMSWLLAGYVAIMLTLGVIATFNTNLK